MRVFLKDVFRFVYMCEVKYMISNQLNYLAYFKKFLGEKILRFLHLPQTTLPNQSFAVLTHMTQSHRLRRHSCISGLLIYPNTENNVPVYA